MEYSLRKFAVLSALAPIVILGGVTTSALLTFYVVPAAFWLFERKAIARRKVEREVIAPAPA